MLKGKGRIAMIIVIRMWMISEAIRKVKSIITRIEKGM